MSFLNNRSHTAVRAWANPQTGLTAAVSVTEYPYDVFAAAALAAAIDDAETEGRTFSGTEDIADVHTFLGTGEKEGQAGAALRRGRFSAIVLAQAGAGGLQEAAGAVVDLTRQLDGRLPAEASAPYRFPSPPSTFAGLAVTSVAVTAAGLASVGVGRARAWTLRRSDDPPVVVVAWPLPAWSRWMPGASDLRRRGIVVVAAQLIALNVIVISLRGLRLAGRGGGGARPGRRPRLHVVVASQGARRPRPEGQRHAVHPSPAGRAAVGIISLAVLGVGVSYALKGIRYLLLKPSLAQLRWSNLLGLSPRGVGVAFAIGGLIVAIIGGILFRVARARPGGHDGFSPSTTGRRCCTCARSGTTRCRWPPSPPRGGPSSSCSRSGGGTRSRRRSPGSSPPTDPSSRWAGRVSPWPRWARHAKHLSDDTWQEQVAMRMHARVQSSSPPGDPGLRWEVSQVVAGGHLDKAVFVFPPLEGGTLARRWEFTSTALAAAGAPVSPPGGPGAHPHRPGGRRRCRDGDDRAARRSVLPHRGRPRWSACSPERPEIRCGEARQLRGQVGAGPVLLTLHGGGEVDGGTLEEGAQHARPSGAPGRVVDVCVLGPDARGAGLVARRFGGQDGEVRVEDDRCRWCPGPRPSRDRRFRCPGRWLPASAPGAVWPGRGPRRMPAARGTSSSDRTPRASAALSASFVSSAGRTRRHGRTAPGAPPRCLSPRPVA